MRPALIALLLLTLQTPPPQDPMGGALGGSAHAVILAEATVEALPPGPLVWTGSEVLLGRVTSVTHRHAPAFVYAAEATTVTVDRRASSLRSGQALFLGANVEHTHVSPARFWEVRLTAPTPSPLPGIPASRQIFTSGTLENPPRPPVQLRFILVLLPPGGFTSVHTHPGPEYIYVTAGEIVYQNALIGTLVLRAGQGHALRPDTPVQKRNPGATPAEFLSFFVVDPNRPFAPEAAF